MERFVLKQESLVPQHRKAPTLGTFARSVLALEDRSPVYRRIVDELLKADYWDERGVLPEGESADFHRRRALEKAKKVLPDREATEARQTATDITEAHRYLVNPTHTRETISPAASHIINNLRTALKQKREERKKNAPQHKKIKRPEDVFVDWVPTFEGRLPREGTDPNEFYEGQDPSEE